MLLGCPISMVASIFNCLSTAQLCPFHHKTGVQGSNTACIFVIDMYTFAAWLCGRVSLEVTWSNTLTERPRLSCLTQTLLPIYQLFDIL